MPSLISATERSVLTGIFDDIFDTFCRNVTVIKAPIKQEITPYSSNNLFGFGEAQQADVFNYVPLSGIYPAVVRYHGDQTADLNSEMSANTFGAGVTIKVRKDARDFINNGETKKIVVDNRQFMLNGDEKKQTFLDSEYYVFELINVH